jgi:hypothetical protein
MTAATIRLTPRPAAGILQLSLFLRLVILSSALK